METTYKFGDKSTSDVTVRLRNRDGRPEWLYCHSSILKGKSKFFAYQLSNLASTTQISDSCSCIEIYCSGSEYDHHVMLLDLLYLPEESLLDTWNSVKDAIGVLRASVTLGCDNIIHSCIQYLEAVPWDDKEEEEILKIAPSLGQASRSILARLHPVDVDAVKNVFLSAVRFATSTATAINGSFPPFSDELKASAQEQVEYMLQVDEDTPLVTAEDDVKSEVNVGLSRMFSIFEKELNFLPEAFDKSPEAAEQKVLRCLLDLEWMCNILAKMDLMKDFVLHWVHISSSMLTMIENEKFHRGLWSVKAKLIEIAGKSLEAVGYGSVTLPPQSRAHFLKTWINYIRKMKPVLDVEAGEDGTFLYKMDNDLCQSIEGAIVSLVLALPSNDQAEILTDWMAPEQLKYPDLSEAFEVWCYRTKTAKRKLVQSLNGVGNPALSL